MPSAFVVARGHRPKVFEAVDATLHHVATGVHLSVTTWRAPAVRATPQAVLPGVFTLRANATCPAPLKLPPVLACTVRAVHAQDRDVLAWPPNTKARNANRVEHGEEVGAVSALSFAEYDGEWTGVPIGA